MGQGFSILRIAAAALLACATAWAAQTPAGSADKKPSKNKTTTKPAYSISVGNLGYHEPLFERVITGRFPVSLNFFSPDQLLFTFNSRELIARDAEPCDGPYDDDQMVHASLLSLPVGKALAQAEWQLHDHNRYLWPVHNGVLLRRCHSFELLPNSLAGHPRLDFPARPMMVQTSPDGRVIVVETQHEKHSPEEHARLIQQAILGDGIVPTEDIDVNIISLDTDTALGRALEHAPIYVPIVRAGLYSALAAQHNHWLIVFQPFIGKQMPMTKVESTCAPLLFPASEDVLLVATCVSTLNFHILVALSREGKELWRDEWLNNLSRPVFALAADNQRFAVATVHTLSSFNGFGLVTDTSSHSEDISVYSTYKGEPLLSISVSPPYSSGQNFALSPDGSQLAVLNHSVIDVYNVVAKH